MGTDAAGSGQRFGLWLRGFLSSVMAMEAMEAMVIISNETGSCGWSMCAREVQSKKAIFFF